MARSLFVIFFSIIAWSIINKAEAQSPCDSLEKRVRALEDILEGVTRYTGTNTDGTTGEVIDFGNVEFNNVRSLIVSSTVFSDQIYSSNVIADKITVGIATQQWAVKVEGNDLAIRDLSSSKDSRYAFFPGLNVDITKST